MHILKNNPFYLKFSTGIEGYLHLFLTPILIFYVSRDIKLSGLFFLIDSLCKFSTYSLSGSIIKPDTINTVIKYSYGLRFLSVISSLLIFYFIEENRFSLLIINNLGFTICNCFYITSLETLFQNHQLFDKEVQSKLTAGDLWCGGIAVLIILTFTLLKISFIWLIPVVILSFSLGLFALHKLVEVLSNLKRVELKKLFTNGLKEFNQTFSFIKSNSDLVTNMIIGYIPFALFLVIEQINIYRFSAQYQDLTMKIMHYSFKSFWFISGALIVPLIVKQSREITRIFSMGVYVFIAGGILSLIPNLTYLNLLGALLLGYSHNLIFVYRKINRRKILDQANVGFQSLGVFFAVEGLSGVISNAYLTLFGQNYWVLLLSFVGSGVYLMKVRNRVTKVKVEALIADPRSIVIEAEKKVEF